MRTILITSEIEVLAGKYGKRMDAATDFSAKPIESLRTLPVRMQDNTTKIMYKKKVKRGGKCKKIYKSTELPEYSQYVDKIVANYSTFNKLLPTGFSHWIAEMEKILSQEDLAADVTIKGKKVCSFANLLVEAMGYSVVREKIYPHFIRHKALDVRTCVYCNAQFAITAETESELTLEIIQKRYASRRGKKPQPRLAKLRATYELDHNLSKSKYPYFCTNFYYLQPCCASCNKHKTDRRLGYSLYVQFPQNMHPLFFLLDNEDIVRFQTKNECTDITVHLKDYQNGTLRINSMRSLPLRLYTKSMQMKCGNFYGATRYIQHRTCVLLPTV